MCSASFETDLTIRLRMRPMDWLVPAQDFSVRCGQQNNLQHTIPLILRTRASDVSKDGPQTLSGPRILRNGSSDPPQVEADGLASACSEFQHPSRSSNELQHTIPLILRNRASGVSNDGPQTLKSLVLITHRSSNRSPSTESHRQSPRHATPIRHIWPGVWLNWRLKARLKSASEV